MRRRTLLGGLGAVGAGVGGLLGTGALSRAAAQQDATVDVVGDGDGYLALTGTSDYATETDAGALALSFTDDQGTENGGGVPVNSTYEFDGVFRVDNDGTREVEVTATIAVDSDAIESFSLYVGDDTDRTLEGSTDGDYNVVAPDEGFAVGVAIETGDERADDRTVAVELAATATEDGSAGDSGGTTGSRIPTLVVDSAASLLNADGDRLTDESVAAVWAEDAATNTDSDGNGDAVDYGDDRIPLVAADSSANAVGFGAMFVEDDDDYTKWDYGSEEFVLNVWDATVGDATDGTATVLWDEGHGQFYDLASFGEFEGYAESHGYDVQATADLEGDLPDADAAVITSPSESFSDSETQALDDFTADGGGLFLHDQADFRNFDETATLDDLADALGLAFRFNDDQVEDEFNNDGEAFVPTTDAFNDAEFDYFADRDDRGLGLDPNATYVTDVEAVTDGDTVDVVLNDREESIRVLGIDTPETSGNSRFERVQEWEGIEDVDYLGNEGDAASSYATGELDGETVEVFFDENEPARDVFDRVLAYIRYDRSGDGSRDTVYNRQAIEDGYSRTYDSGLARHDEFLAAETAAREAGRQVWRKSDPANSPEIRDRDVEELFLPVGSSVVSTSGAVSDDRVPVYAELTAEQNGDDTYEGILADIPTVALDEGSGVAVFGSPLIDESYEPREGSDYNADRYENFVFLTNVIDALADGDSPSGDVLIDGGHGQFAADYALSAEDAAYYLRYLEGQGGIEFQGINDIAANLDAADTRAVVVTAPAEAYTDVELDALASFRDDGGAVVLMNSGAPLPAARENLDAVAEALGTDLRANDDIVVDKVNNDNGDERVPTTSNFDRSFDLYSAYS
jgi:endonuclease YncB( thermonuclease family)